MNNQSSTATIGSNDYQVQLEQREAAKITYKREQNEIRRQRFLDARTRTIGVDVAALDAQVEEKNKAGRDRDEIHRLESIIILLYLDIDLFSILLSGIRAMEMERVLEAAALEEKQMRMHQNEVLKESWSSAMESKRMISPQSETIYEETGKAAAQIFSGEDRERNMRVRMQKEQMRDWISERKEERYERKISEEEEDKLWAEFVRESAFIREQAELR